MEFKATSTPNGDVLIETSDRIFLLSKVHEIELSKAKGNSCFVYIRFNFEVAKVLFYKEENAEAFKTRYREYALKREV